MTAEWDFLEKMFQPPPVKMSEAVVFRPLLRRYLDGAMEFWVYRAAVRARMHRNI